MDRRLSTCHPAVPLMKLIPPRASLPTKEVEMALGIPLIPASGGRRIPDASVADRPSQACRTVSSQRGFRGTAYPAIAIT
jgi:hypothetical protein